MSTEAKQLIQYYDRGWRAGYLFSLHRKYARVMPIIPSGAIKVPRLKKVKLEDLRPADGTTRFIAPRKGGFKIMSYLDPLTGNPWSWSKS